MRKGQGATSRKRRVSSLPFSLMMAWRSFQNVLRTLAVTVTCMHLQEKASGRECQQIVCRTSSPMGQIRRECQQMVLTRC